MSRFTRNTILPLFAVAMFGFGVPSAQAWNWIWDCRGPVVWSSNNVTFEPSITSFPNGTPFNAAVNAMRTSWNTQAPGSRYQIQHTWVTGTVVNLNDGRNSILVPNVADWNALGLGNALAVTFSRRSSCNIWPFARAELREADILFNPSVAWDHQLNPPLPLPWTINSILVGIHEHGHAFGLDHENNVLATMNAFYPGGGPIGNSLIQPHANDVGGARHGYGTSGTQRDVAASAFRRTGAGTSAEIVPPAASDRNAHINFQFTVENRGTTNQNPVHVRFYLSPDRIITTGDTQIGAVNLSMNAATVATMNASVTIPANAPTGNQFIGWIVDPLNAIPEADEGNNFAAMATPTLIRTNRAPTACFSASPNWGEAPLFVQFNASCSSDPDGDPLVYTWDFGDGTGGSGMTTSHMYWTSGFYQVTLTVRDPSNASSSAFDSIVVQCDGTEIFPCLQY